MAVDKEMIYGSEGICKFQPEGYLAHLYLYGLDLRPCRCPFPCLAGAEFYGDAPIFILPPRDSKTFCLRNYVEAMICPFGLYFQTPLK